MILNAKSLEIPKHHDVSILSQAHQVNANSLSVDVQYPLQSPEDRRYLVRTFVTQIVRKSIRSVSAALV